MNRLHYFGMDRLLLKWLSPSFSSPQETSTSFRVRIKLNTKEADRRFAKIRSNFLMAKQDIIDFCRMVEHDRTLEKALLKIDEELLIAVVALRSYRLGEREYIGDAVLFLEDLMEETKALFLRAYPAVQDGEGYTWDELNSQAKNLAEDIVMSFMVLAEMREMVHDEVYPQHVRQGQTTTWRDWLSSWICVPSQRPKSGQSQSGRKVQEHHEREHLFTNHREAGNLCRCLDYR